MVSTGSGGSRRGTITGVPLGASVSPVRVSASLATAAMSPAGTSVSCSCSLPRMVKRPCSRSSVPVRGLISVRVGPEGARQHLEERDLADVGVGDGLEDEGQRLAGGVGRHLRRCRRPASTVTGGRSSGDGPISQMKSARRSMPISLVADPQTTGKTLASATPLASVSSSSFG